MSNVIAFSNRAPVGSRLLTRDKIDLCLWETGCQNPEICRVVIYDGSNDGADPRGGDLVLVYGPDTPWARWGVAREDSQIVLWECGHGVDIGRYPTMREALAALELNVDHPPRRNAKRQGKLMPAAMRVKPLIENTLS